MSDVPYTRLPRPTLWLLRGDVFTMGGDAPDDTPRFEADVRSIYIGKSPVTNAQYEAYDPDRARCAASSGDDDPVVEVSFRDAVGYCDWYSRRSGKQFRLPTEVEWEFACRAATTTRFFWGDDPGPGDRHVWDRSTSAGRCQPIETAQPNAFGLYDMLGNVWEWTSSRFVPYPLDDGDDAIGDTDCGDPPDGPDNRVIRGGSFRTHRADVGCATRRAREPTTHCDDLGFRIVRFL